MMSLVPQPPSGESIQKAAERRSYRSFAIEGGFVQGRGQMPEVRSRKVLLFLPPSAGRVFGPPLGLLSLAGSLRQAGYEPCIIDGALHDDFLKRIEREAGECLCLGISLLTGPMIRDAI